MCYENITLINLKLSQIVDIREIFSLFDKHLVSLFSTNAVPWFIVELAKMRTSNWSRLEEELNETCFFPSLCNTMQPA